MKKFRLRRTVIVLLVTVVFGGILVNAPDMWQPVQSDGDSPRNMQVDGADAREALDRLEVKGRAPKTGYARAQFGNGWASANGCDTRNTILYRDLTDTIIDESCKVASGTLNDPYTGEIVRFVRGAQTSQLVQIDHVVALSNAWQTGAQQLTEIQRIALANDPLNLLAVDGSTNQQKSDGDAATWLPSSKSFRCQYVARQIAVKYKYSLWVTVAEKEAIVRVLQGCSEQRLPKEAS